MPVTTIDCDMTTQIDFDVGYHHPSSNNLFQITTRHCRLNGTGVKYTDHVVPARHVNGGVSLSGENPVRVQITVDPANYISGFFVRDANQYNSDGYQYRGYVSHTLKAVQCQSLLAGHAVTIKAVCKDTFSASDDTSLDMVDIGTATITLSPVSKPKKQNNQVSRAANTRYVVDEYMAKLPRVTNSASVKIDASYLYNSEMPEAVKNSNKYVVLMHMGVPIEIRDNWQRRPESCQTTAQVLDHILDIGCVIRKCDDFEGACHKDPEEAKLVLVSAFRAVGNSVSYENDSNSKVVPGSSEGALTDRYTNIFGVARTTSMAGIDEAVVVGDCEDSANAACKVSYLFLHAPPDSSPRVLAAQKLLQEKYDCVTLVMMASNGKITPHAHTSTNRKDFWATCTTQDVADISAKENWGTESYCHTVAVMIPKGVTEAMIDGTCSSGSLPPLTLMEGTGWCVNEQTRTSLSDRTNFANDLDSAVRRASGGKTNVTCLSELEDRKFYRTVSHMTAPDGKGYFIVDENGVRSPHFERLLKDPGSLRLKQMLPTLTQAEKDMFAVKMTETCPDFPVVLSTSRKPEWATADQIKEHIVSDKKVIGILRGRPVQADALGKYDVMCMPVSDGVNVWLCSAPHRR